MQGDFFLSFERAEQCRGSRLTGSRSKSHHRSPSPQNHHHRCCCHDGVRRLVAVTKLDTETRRKKRRVAFFVCFGHDIFSVELTDMLSSFFCGWFV